MMSNKKSKNGFMDFCFYQQRLDASLSKFSVPQLVEKCSPIWEALTPGERMNFKRLVSSLLYLMVAWGDLIANGFLHGK